MRTAAAVLLLALTAAKPAALGIPIPTTTQIEELIAAPPASAGPVRVSDLDFRWGAVLVDTPFTRLAAAAAKAKERYLTLSKEEATALSVPTVDVWVVPDLPARLGDPVVNVEHVVVKTPQGSAIQPLAVEVVPRTAANRLGEAVTVRGMRATFSAGVLVEGAEIRLILDRAIVVTGRDGVGIDAPGGGFLESKDVPVVLDAERIARLARAR